MALKIERRPYVENLFRADRFEFNRHLAKIGKPVDRDEWDMTPPTVNAYYNPQLNEIVFPAGILQPPFFNPKADDAINYGGMGVVIGHELSHGFDDEGRQFDAQGNLKDWWTPPDAKDFNSRAGCVINQFDGYYVEKNLHENGKLVVGESIGDLGGLAISYRAFGKSREEKPRPADIDGFAPQQRFFLGYAQIWKRRCAPRFQSEIPPLRSAQGRNDPSADGFANAFQHPLGTGRAMTSRQTARRCINSEFRIYTSYFRLSFACLSIFDPLWNGSVNMRD